MRITLDLAFKGSRQHLHSTDIFDALVRRYIGHSPEDEPGRVPSALCHPGVEGL